MGRTAEKIAHLDRTASSRPGYREVLLPFREVFAYVLGRESATGIRFSVPDGNGEVRIRGGLPMLSAELLSVERGDAASFFSGLLGVLRRVGREGGDALDRIGRAVAEGEIDLAALYAACLARQRDTLESAAAALGVPSPLLVFVLEIPLKTALEEAASALDPSAFAGWTQGYCPVCGSGAGMDEISGEEGKRHFSCSACFFRWSWPRIRCPYCGNDDPETVSYFTAGEGPVRVGVCRKCSRYIKTRDARIGNASVPMEAEDLATLHLDLLAAREGFERGR